MNAVTLKEAKLNLEQLVEQVIADAEATIVVTESGNQVVFLPLDEYNSWKETLYLLANPPTPTICAGRSPRLRRMMCKSTSSSKNEADQLAGDRGPKGVRYRHEQESRPDRS
jgi:prevent-host-death family protein